MTPALLSRLDHVQVAAPPGCDAAARAFYGGVLGLEELPMPVALRGRASCWFRCGDLEIHVGIQADFQPARKAHPAFVAADLDALRERLRDHGMEVRDDHTLTDRRRFFADDPWGNRLEFLQMNPTTIQP